MQVGIRMNYFFLLCVSLLLSCNSAWAGAVTVKIGGYDFPPFVEKEGREGIVRDLIKKMNSSQSKFHFEFVFTSANRRYRDFKAQKFDVIMFEDESWSWRKKGIRYSASTVLAHGGELAVALNEATRDQSYFNVLTGKKVKVVLGFHYRSQDMKTDPELLASSGVLYGKSYLENLDELLAKKIDITFVNSFFLNRIIEQNRELKDKLLVCKKPDQTFELRALVHPNSPITIGELERLGLNKIIVSE